MNKLDEILVEIASTKNKVYEFNSSLGQAKKILHEVIEDMTHFVPANQIDFKQNDWINRLIKVKNILV